MSLHLHPAGGRSAEEERRMDEALAAVDDLALRSLREQQARRRRRLAVGAALSGMVLALAGGYALRPAPPADPRVSVSEGWRLWRERRHHEAEAHFLAATTAAPSLVEGWNGLGWARLNQGSATGARAAFERCLALNDAHAACHNGLGNLFFGRCEDARAETHWSAAAAHAPAARYSLLRLLLAQERFEEAKRMAARVAGDPPGSPDAAALAAAAERGELDEVLRRKLRRGCRTNQGGA
jgi:Flp pilus assembly protein TadD